MREPAPIVWRPPPPSELLSIHVRTLYRPDAEDRLIATNEPHARPAPRVYVGTASGARVVRVRQDVPAATARRWMESVDTGLRRRLEADVADATEYRGPAFVFPPQAREPEGREAVSVGPWCALHPELVARGWRHEETPPYAGVVEDGHVVGVCYSARSTPEAAEGGVETAPPYRRHGLAVRAVRAWAAAVQESGRLALYSTEWTNEASRRVAARLGAIEYAEDWHFM